ncbi:Branched-chain amino acid transport protein (AzlD) [Lachnospiraceae bacterium C7]|nr:Branched-chain amino acid transport protein (AzlD) [Lachnospiraceae bacterium C7]
MRTYISLLVMIVVIYLVRALPMIIFKKNITNVYIKSFLHYVPYVTLAVMTFPAIIFDTAHIYEGIAAFIVGIIVAYITEDLFKVAISCCGTVLVVTAICNML